MPSARLELATNGLCLPATAFAARLMFSGINRLWSGLSLRFTRLLLSLYTFLAFIEARLGSGLPYRFRRFRLPRL